MKIDELIKELEAVREEHGNINVPWQVKREDKNELHNRPPKINKEFDSEIIWLSNGTNAVQIPKVPKD